MDHIILTISGPSTFQWTVWKPSHFPTQLEIHARGTAWRTFRINGSPCGVRFESEHHALSLAIFSGEQWTSEKTQELLRRIRIGYGLEDDLDPFYALAPTCPPLADAVRNLYGMRSSCPENLFEMAVLSVLLQNTTVRRSQDMLATLLRLFGTEVSFDGVQLSCFFGPEQLAAASYEELRAQARVGYRDKTLVAIGKHFEGTGVQEVLSRTDREDLLKWLCLIRGIGPYSAGVIAASVLRDPHEFGLDAWNRKILGRLLLGDESAEPQIVRARCEELFGPYAGWAVEYLVENRYLNSPVCPIYATPAEARAASYQWPRPPHSTPYAEEGA